MAVILFRLTFKRQAFTWHLCAKKAVAKHMDVHAAFEAGALHTVRTAVMNVVGPDVDVDLPFFDAGVDSLQAQELLITLQACAKGTEFPGSLIFDHPTTRQLSAILEATGTTVVPPGPARPDGEMCVCVSGMVQRSSSHEPLRRLSPSVVRIQQGMPHKTPLFGVPAITGSGLYVTGLRECMDHPLYALEEEYILTGRKLAAKSVPALGAKFVGIIGEVVEALPTQSFHVVGGSFGGIVAHQVALAALKAGRQVRKLLMIDPLPPAPWSTFRAEKLEIWYCAAFLLRLSLLANWEQIAAGFHDTPEHELGVRVAEQLAKAGRRPFTADSVLQATREMHTARRYYELTHDFVLARDAEAMEAMGPYDGGTLMILVTERTQFFESVYHLSPEESSSEWAKRYGRVEGELMVPGGHIELIHNTATNSEPLLGPVVSDFLRLAEEDDVHR